MPTPTTPTIVNLHWQTLAPTGLSMTRDGNKFTCTWKIADANYGSGQIVQWKAVTFGGVSDTWNTLSNVSATTTAKSFTINFSNYMPTTQIMLNSVKFRVRGTRSNFDVIIGPRSAPVQINRYACSVSEWTEYTYLVNAPDKPTGSAVLQQSPADTTRFTAAHPAPTTAAGVNINIPYESILVSDCNYTKGENAPWTGTGSGIGRQSGTFSAAGGYVDISETNLSQSTSYTRWFRCKARGPRGSSAWLYLRHVYATPYNPVITRAVYAVRSGAAIQYTVTVEWTEQNTVAHPVDVVAVQWCKTVPGANMTVPSGAQWEEEKQIRDSKQADGYSFIIDEALDEEEVIFVRVIAYYGTNYATSDAKPVIIGKLNAPTFRSINIDSQTYVATIVMENNSDVPGAFIAITLKTPRYPAGYIAGIIAAGSTTTTIQCGSDTAGADITFTAMAVVGTATPVGNPPMYAVAADMKSDSVSQGGTVPAAPVISLAPTNIPGTIRVAFTRPWASANCAELSWSDRSDAWQSTADPETYTIYSKSANVWNIAELETGKTWYVRAKLGIKSEDSETWSSYSDTRDLKLASAPVKPVLNLSRSIMTPSDTVEASWTYSSSDRSPQGSAVVAEVTTVNGQLVYTPVGTATTQQHVTISAKKQGWTHGTTHNLCVRVTSQAGQISDAWSDPVPVIVADAITAAITQTSLEDVTITVDGETTTFKGLTEMPLTLTVTGAGSGGTTSVAIERAQEYHVARPDESSFDGYDGETIATYTQTGSAQISINKGNLTGSLDDGALYRIVATVRDDYGQSAEASLDFIVKWDEQAIIPEATAEIDTENMIAILTPVAPTGASQTATCDIYRLSVDKPTLIYQDAEFSTEYVDPFPTLGNKGGHRFVYKTENGDYITEDNTLAWFDTKEAEEDILDADYNIIDWDTGRVNLEYNVNLSQSWKKDFKNTAYLGGMIQGDWNPAVQRTGTLTVAAIVGENDDIIEAMRRLAVFPGICHVRTKEGSSYAADIQVSEDISQDDAHKIVIFSLAVTRVDADELDGMTLEDWERTHPEEGE